MNRDPYNHVGKQILEECKKNRMTYGYACVEKLENATYEFKETLHIRQDEHMTEAINRGVREGVVKISLASKKR